MGLYKHLLVYIIVFLLLASAAGCAGPATETGGNVFAIYLLEGENMRELPGDLNELVLREEPWLTIDEIDFYDYSTHYIYLKEDRFPPFPSELPTSLLYPFVVVAGGERCYPGHFVSTVSSYAPPNPVIMMDDFAGFYPEDIIAIEEGYFGSTAPDLRDDKRVRQALLESHKLREGISVELKDVEIVSRRAGETTLSYTFTVTNNGDEALYVPDPDNMGSGLFHYYNNGVVLQNATNPRVSFWAEHKSVTAPESHESWEKAWFTRISSGESIDRTVILNGYPEIPPGDYSCRFSYSGPHNIDKSERILPNGRLWLGRIQSSALMITVGN